MMTPRRKRSAKTIARRSLKTLANECFSDVTTIRYLLKQFHKTIKTEINSLSSLQSVFCHHSPNDLKMFSWDNLYNELQEKAPFLLDLLKAATETRNPRENRDAVICICAAVLLKYRLNKMNLVQKVISLVLHAGRCSKQVSGAGHFSDP